MAPLVRPEDNTKKDGIDHALQDKQLDESPAAIELELAASRGQ